MLLEYTLSDNPITPDPNDCTARVQNVTSYDLEAIKALMLDKGTTLTRTDIDAGTTNLCEALADCIAKGGTINIPLFRTSFSITGVFRDSTDTFDPARHSINLNLNPGPLLLEALKKITLTKVAATDSLPQVVRVQDSTTKSINDQITPAGAIIINGSLLKIAGDHPSNGVYFIAQDGTATPVEIMVENNPSKLIVMVPALQAGTYTLQITTQYNGTGDGVKTPRTKTFKQPLTIRA